VRTRSLARHRASQNPGTTTVEDGTDLAVTSVVFLSQSAQYLRLSDSATPRQTRTMSAPTRAADARSAPDHKRRSLQPDPEGRAGLVQLADGRLLASRRWAGAGVPLVALHGLFDCSLGWEHVAAATSRPFVAFDLPGFGRSGMPAENRFASYAPAAGIYMTLVSHGHPPRASAARPCDTPRVPHGTGRNRRKPS